MQPVIIISILCTTLCICTLVSNAQTFAEWWQQKKTRIQYLRQQAVALSALKKTVDKGYQIAEQGIRTIWVLKEDEFGLHDSHFHSLETASPVITNSPELSSCLSWQHSLINLISDDFQAYSTDRWLKPPEIIFILGLYTNTIAQVQEEIQHLQNLVTDSRLKMSDGERLLGIESIREETEKHYESIMTVSETINDLIMERKLGSGDSQKTLNLFP